MERMSLLGVRLMALLILGTCPATESQNPANARHNHFRLYEPTEHHTDLKSILQHRHQGEDPSIIAQLDGGIDSSFTDILVRRYRYQGPALGQSEKVEVQKRIVDEFIHAHQDKGRFFEEEERNISIKSNDKQPDQQQALPYRVGEGWQLDDTLITKHFQLLNDASILEECAQRQWTPWSGWSDCSAPCGFASTFQYRDCVFAERLVNKRDCGYFSFRDCKGKDMNRVQCQGLPACTETTAWGPWGECSALCQAKVGVRKRTMIKESSRGTKQTMRNTTQVESCMGSRPDCVGWSQWSRCSVSCSNQVGIRERHLVVITPDNFYRRDASRVQMEPCVGQRILCEEWTSWGAWTSCDCRRRQRRRARMCERRFVFKSSSIGIRVSDSLCHGQAWMSVPCAPVDGACKVRSRRRKIKKNRRRPFLSSLMSRRKRLRPKKRVPDCVLGCQGLPYGRYPSCRSCFHYWQCYSRGQKERMCAKRRRWDHRVRKCLSWSSTCPGV